jgi:lysophospholipase L1-like esterase
MHSLSHWILTIFLAAAIGYIAYSAYIIRRSFAESKVLIAETLPYQQHPAHPTYRVLVAGDSTAVGVGAGDPHLSTAGRLGADMPDADITNIAVSGMKVGALAASFAPYVSDHYDLALIQIGANDIVELTSYQDIRESLRASLAAAHAIAGRTIILTSGDLGEGPAFHWPVTIYLSHRTRMIRRIFIEESASYPETTYLDIYTLLGGIDFKADISRWYAPDYFHLSGEGYGLWYGEIKKVM